MTIIKLKLHICEAHDSKNTKQNKSISAAYDIKNKINI
jgi:hypothetical protein